MSLELPNCTCTFRGVGRPMDTTYCELHIKASYSCPRTNCGDYRPSSEPKMRLDGGRIWPLCLCGETAQEHN